MWVDFLSMAAVGILAACLIYIIRRTLAKRGRDVPRWLLPATIGAGMIAYSVWSEYSWYDRVTASLPPTVAVVSHGERSAFWAPWTYLKPVTVRFMAMDTRARVQSTERPGLFVTELLLVERWQPTRKVPMAFDCSSGRRADLVGGAQVDPDGSLRGGAQWSNMEPDSPMLRVACNMKTAS